MFRLIGCSGPDRSRVRLLVQKRGDGPVDPPGIQIRDILILLFMAVFVPDGDVGIIRHTFLSGLELSGREDND